MIYDLVKSFDEDLQGAVDVDKYFNEAKDAVSKTSLRQLISEFNETLKQHPKFRWLPDAEPDALYLMLTAGALFKASCEEPEEPDKDVYILLGYSYSSLAAGKTLDAVVFLLASIALARGKSNVAAELLRKMSLDLEGVVNFACGAVELGMILERRLR
jgi:hypothetical protein